MKNNTLTATGTAVHMKNIWSNSKFLQAYSNAAVSGWMNLHSAWSGFNGILYKPTVWVTPKKTNQPVLHIGPVTLTGITLGTEPDDYPVDLLDSAGFEIKDINVFTEELREEYDDLDERYKVLQLPPIYHPNANDVINEGTRTAAWEQYEVCYRKKERFLETMESRYLNARDAARAKS